MHFKVTSTTISVTEKIVSGINFHKQPHQLLAENNL